MYSLLTGGLLHTLVAVWLFCLNFKIQKFEANQTVDIRLVYEVTHDSHVLAVGGSGGLRVELMENKQSSL